MAETLKFESVARLPLPGDNVAIASRSLVPGTAIEYQENVLTLSHDVLIGHRFAVKAIGAGEPLLSWEVPFGTASVDIGPGDYVINKEVLTDLRYRSLDISLPEEPNFTNILERYYLDESKFRPGKQVELAADARTFSGYRRHASRGVGTRNHIVLLGTTSRTASYVRQLAERMKDACDAYPNVDGVVAVAHTEGGGTTYPNNAEFLLRAMSGYLVHPNVGAILAVDYGVEPITNRLLKEYAEANNYPIDLVPLRFMSLEGKFQADLDRGERIVKDWLDTVNHTARTEEPVTHLKLAMQCGGSDAFSGVSGNPLQGWLAREIVRHGGSAVVAETDELIGAEEYFLSNFKDLETAQRFLDMIEDFKERVSNHGNSAEGNPSGGNKLRGLYNIAIKSVGAAMKRNPDVRVDHLLRYSERLTDPGFYFMDTPGNDLESIAGEVAGGCNLISFVTGNGSITNFPFVPTVKIITTTDRYNLLPNEMDINAGRYLDGTPMDEVGQDTFEYALEVASGKRSKGERAGHYQISIWRNWEQTDASRIDELQNAALPEGKAIPIQTDKPEAPLTYMAYPLDKGYATDRIGLILPVSLCAGQVSRLVAEHLNQSELANGNGVNRFQALVHTEGCGYSGDSAYRHTGNTIMGYITHPNVSHGLLLEHGCEKTHNGYFKHRFVENGIDPEKFGWASVQLDGGIESVTQKIEAWFSERTNGAEPPVRVSTDVSHLRIGLLSSEKPSDTAAESLARLTRLLVGAGATVIVPEGSPLLESPQFCGPTLGSLPAQASTPYARHPVEAGFHIMESPTSHWVEAITGLGGTGAEVILAHVGEQPMQSHPMIPVLQVSESEHEGIEMVLGPDIAENVSALTGLILDTASGRLVPASQSQGNVDFQVTRGLLGIST